MRSVGSLRPELLQAVADFTANDISEVVLNDTLSVKALTKETENGECTIEYFVSAGTFEAITSIKLLNAQGNVLSAFAVYVPVLDNIVIKHIITVKEA